MYENKVVEANMFTVNIRKKSQTVYQQSLVTRKSSNLKGLKNWQLKFPTELATYFALYPEAWTVYELPNQNVFLTCNQLSPILPHNYKDSCLPVGLFNWTVENNNDEDIEFALMFTWQSGSASNKFELKRFDSRSFEKNGIAGVVLSQSLKNMPLDYCLAARQSVSFYFFLFIKNVPIKFLFNRSDQSTF